jgi:4a-hydroxytetrahydrobiopterin dehydratase
MKKILDAAQLCAANCLALDNIVGNAYSAVETELQLKVLFDWRLNNGFIERQYSFKDYYATVSFVNALAWMIHAQDHHPELLVTYNKCLVKFNTHSVNGISMNDFVCAAKADALYAAPTMASTL